MRKLFLLVAAFVAACGSDSKDGGAPASGTVGGKAFKPAEVRAVVAGTGTTPCTLPGLGPGGTSLPVGVKAFALQFTSYANACGDFSGTCTVHQSAEVVTVIFARLNPPSVVSPTPSEPALTPGTYTLNASVAGVTPEPTTGTLVAAFAQALATNATCVGAPSLSVQGGTLRVDQVSGPITGHVAVTFQDGSTFQGDFSAPICTGVNLDVCSLASQGGALCSGTPSCVP